MDKLTFDTGIKEYEINGRAVLRFNPTDPNMYARFMKAVEKIQAVERECLKKVELGEGEKNVAQSAIQVLADADSMVKDILSEAFGHNNDFHDIFDGVNVIALRRDGKTRVLDAFIDAVLPIIESGLQDILAQDEAMVQRYTAGYE